MTEVTCFFALQSARITDDAKLQLDDLSLQMRENLALLAAVTGHTSSAEAAGDGGLNFHLFRAEGIKNYLVTRHSIDPARISITAVVDANVDAELDCKAVIVLS